MKLLSTILLFYISALAINPCVCTWEDDATNSNNITDTTKQHSDDCEDNCHPFCTDGCCFAAVDNVVPTYFFYSSTIETQTIHIEYSTSYFHRMYDDYWHPPKNI